MKRLNALVLSLFVSTSARPAAPEIVAKFSVNCSSTVDPFTLWFPVEAGDYRLTVYGEIAATPGTDGFLCYELGWTDDLQSRTLISILGFIGSTPQYWSEMHTLHVIGNCPITLAIVVDVLQGCNMPSSYGAFFTLERL